MVPAFRAFKACFGKGNGSISNSHRNTIVGIPGLPQAVSGSRSTQRCFKERDRSAVDCTRAPEFESTQTPTRIPGYGAFGVGIQVAWECVEKMSPSRALQTHN
eukprot:571844-Rhodomonas_salina.1